MSAGLPGAAVPSGAALAAFTPRDEDEAAAWLTEQIEAMMVGNPAFTSRADCLTFWRRLLSELLADQLANYEQPAPGWLRMYRVVKDWDEAAMGLADADLIEQAHRPLMHRSRADVEALADDGHTDALAELAARHAADCEDCQTSGGCQCNEGGR